MPFERHAKEVLLRKGKKKVLLQESIHEQ